MASKVITNSSIVTDRKKRALEALDRRFAAAKADLLQQQHNESKKTKRVLKEEEEGKEEKGKEDVSLVSPSCPSFKKALIGGHLTFCSQTPQRATLGVSDVEAHNPAYYELSQPIHENLLTVNNKASSSGDVVNKVVNDLLQNGDKAQKVIKEARSKKFDNWLLLDNFVPKVSAFADARLRALQSHSKRSCRHMSMRQHRKYGSFDLPQEFHNFDLFKPMHEMWKEYIIELLKEIGKKQFAQGLLMADLHGALLLVVECKTTAFKGVSGIMIRETSETFGIITQDNRFRVVPKKGSVFIFQAACWKITLYGDKLSSRNIGT